MVPGAWPDPWRGGDIGPRSLDAFPQSHWRRRTRAFRSGLHAIAWPTLVVLGLALPDRFEVARALTISLGLTLVVAERLQEARARRDADDLAAFARALESEKSIALLSSLEEPAPPVHGKLPPPPCPPRIWRKPRRVETKVPAWPPMRTSQRVTIPETPVPISQRPTVPDSESEIQVALLEAAVRR